MDTVEELLLEGRERVHLVQYQKYGKVTDQGVSRVFSDGDVKRIQRKFSRDQLLRDIGVTIGAVLPILTEVSDGFPLA